MLTAENSLNGKPQATAMARDKVACGLPLNEKMPDLLHTHRQRLRLIDLCPLSLPCSDAASIAEILAALFR